MNFSCPSCRAKYYVADERVVGRTLKMKCRKCPAEIPIQGRPASVAPLLSTADGGTTIQATASSISSDRLRLSLPHQRVDALRPPPRDPSLPPGAELPPRVVFRVAIAGKSEGPFDREDLRAGLERGDITPQSFLWRPGMTRWTRFEEVEELSFLLESTPPPSSASPLSVRPGALVEVGQESQAPSRPLTREEREDRERAIEEELGFGEFSRRGKARPAASFRSEAAAPLKTLSSGPPVVLPTSPGPGRWLVVASTLGSLALGIWVGSQFAGESTPEVIREIVEVPVDRVADNVPPPEVTPGGGERSEPKVAAAKQAAVGSPIAPTGAPRSGEVQKSSGVALEKTGSGLAGLEGLGSSGPSAGPASDSVDDGQVTGRQPLSAGQIKRTVSKYQGGVKRGCWQPALEGASGLAPTTARVSVTIKVAKDGSVISAAAGGDPAGYPGLSRCIAQRVRDFRFPQSSGETEVTIPFVFAAQ